MVVDAVAVSGENLCGSIGIVEGGHREGAGLYGRARHDAMAAEGLVRWIETSSGERPRLPTGELNLPFRPSIVSRS